MFLGKRLKPAPTADGLKLRGYLALSGHWRGKEPLSAESLSLVEDSACKYLSLSLPSVPSYFSRHHHGGYSPYLTTKSWRDGKIHHATTKMFTPQLMISDDHARFVLHMEYGYHLALLEQIHCVQTSRDTRSLCLHSHFQLCMLCRSLKVLSRKKLSISRKSDSKLELFHVKTNVLQCSNFQFLHKVQQNQDSFFGL